MLYEISYDLRKPGRDYSRLYEAIKGYGDWAHPLDSVWIISASQTAVQVRDHLKSRMDANDGLLVTRMSGEAAWMGLNDEVSKWLHDKLGRAA